MKIELIQMHIEKIKANYQAIGQELGGMKDQYRIDETFEEIIKQNKELDKKYQEFIKLVKDLDMPDDEWPGLYKEILKFYSEQNQALSDFTKTNGAFTKQSRKTQQLVNDLMEKYIKEIEKALE